MKILLLGEFSSLHKNLKEGLVKLGHDVTIASTGDDYKNVPADIEFGSKFKGRIGEFERKVIKPLINLKKLYGYDVVQLINPFIFYHYFPRTLFYKKIIKNNKKFFILAAGSDAYYWRYGKLSLRYGPFKDFLKYDRQEKTYYMETMKAFDFNEKLVNSSDGIIPIMYEYEESYSGHNKRLETIPIPMNLDKVKYKKNIVKNKIVIFHGLSRYGFKGTRHVEEAFNILKEKYPNDLELIIDGNMPLDEYLILMERVNVVIDQVYSYSLGVNGIYALAMGKVVMGGAEPESLKSHGINDSPVINLKPTAESIILAVERILFNKKYISDIGKQSRDYVEKNHDYIKIASRYLDVWTK